MKGIAILLVIIGHLIQFNNIDGGEANTLFGIIYSFHMPLFFILSGYVASSSLKNIANISSLMNFYLKKVYVLVLPLLTWSLLVNKYFFSKNFQFISLDDVLNTLLHPGLWFLQVLFEIYILFGIFSLLVHYLNKKGSIYLDIILVSLILALLVIGSLMIDKTHFMTLTLFTAFFFLGSFISRYSFIEKFIMNKYIYALSLLLFLLSSTHWMINGNSFDDLLKVVDSTTAFIVLLHLTQQTNWPHIIDSQIQMFGKESLAIYVMQFYLTSNIRFPFEMAGFNLFIQFLLLTAVAGPIAYICVLSHKIFEHSSILNFLLYGKRL
jgi:fucose 4-O-acetylase-like acetyltransferase